MELFNQESDSVKMVPGQIVEDAHDLSDDYGLSLIWVEEHFANV